MTTSKTTAIVLGMERAAKLGYVKPYDVALCIETCLEDAGFRIIKRSVPPTPTPTTKEN